MGYMGREPLGWEIQDTSLLIALYPKASHGVPGSLVPSDLFLLSPWTHVLRAA